MSIKLMSRVWEMRGLPTEYKIVLLRMADHANSDGWCYPGQASLAQDCGFSERTVRRKLSHLDRLGIVEKLRRHRRGPQEYQLWIPEEPEHHAWGEYAERITDDTELRLDHGWFDQDRPQLAGQTRMGLKRSTTTRADTGVSALPGGLDRTQDRTQDRTGVTTRPATGDRSIKGTTNRTLEPRARSSDEEQALRALALERAVMKGAHNPEGLASKILAEDRSDLIDELARRREATAKASALEICTECDERGFRWVDDDTAVPCDHQAALDTVVA